MFDKAKKLQQQDQDRRYQLEKILGLDVKTKTIDGIHFSSHRLRIPYTWTELFYELGKRLK